MGSGVTEARGDLLARLSRIEGQVRGIGRMIEGGRPCEEVLTQMRSAIQALCRAQDLVLRRHLRRCVRESLGAGTSEERDRNAEELVLLLSRYREP